MEDLDRKFYLSITAQKILLYFWEQVKTFARDELNFVVPEREFLDLLGVDEFSDDHIQELLSEILREQFFIVRREDDWQIFSVFSVLAFIDGQGHIEINSEIIPFLEEYYKTFTVEQFSSIFNLKTRYSISLLKFLLQNGEKVQTIDVCDLQKVFALNYKKPVEVVKFVRSAIADINKNTNIVVKLTENTKGTKILSLTFELGEN